MSDKIVIKGARVHNLKNVDVEIPRDQLVVITGLSGSGKSSLAFDTIYAEGQRRYVESLSAYARQFLGQMDKPDVDHIEGLSPAISIDQRTTSKNPRSTVGTVTEIYDYLRLLYARIGIVHCPKCGIPINRQSIDQIVDSVTALGERTRILVLSPIIRGKKGEHVKIFEDAVKAGYARVRVDGNTYDLQEPPKLEKNKKHTIEIVVDRIVISPDIRGRLTESVELALNQSSGGIVTINDVDKDADYVYSQEYACHDCGISIEEMSPRSFSFNSPYGACKTCSGLGFELKLDPNLILPNSRLSLDDGAIDCCGWNSGNTSSGAHNVFKALAKHYGFSTSTPIGELPEHIIHILLYGTGDEKVTVMYQRSDGNGQGTYTNAFEGVIPNLERRYRETGSEYMKGEIEGYMSQNVCNDCKGDRLRPEMLAVTIGGKSISQACRLPVRDALAFFSSLSLTEKETLIAAQVLKEINERLGFLLNVGLDYLSMSRASATLSGGEAQRIRLATQIGSYLMGVLYILDEPSIGLHQRDNEKLLSTLKRLRDLGNTLIVVEHDEDTMRASDHIIDMGPGAGSNGGEVVAIGTCAEIMDNPASVTGQYLSGAKRIPTPATRGTGNGASITIRGARENNLKGVDVTIPLGCFVVVTGVSGSGKSSLVNEILHKRLSVELNGAKRKVGAHDGIDGMEHLDKVIDIDQSPIGRTPRSNPATYTGLFGEIRELFATTNDAKLRGYKPGRFSFNVRGGRCEACSGDGIIKIEMHFLPDVYVPCEVCKGKRYNRETLEVHYKGKSIADVLDMTVDEGCVFFENVPRILRKLTTLRDVGLGYIKIGQSSTTLSGGEAQRVKLATELSRRATGRTVYILDEPTTGLHIADVHRLIEVLQLLVSTGNTVVIIEHNLDVIKVADYIVDLGPEGGDLGGTVVCHGTPEDIAACDASYTGRFLKLVLEQ